MSGKLSAKRPTSPHLQIYKPQLTSVLSISHRFAGVVLFVGCLVFCLIFFLAIAYPKIWDNLYQAIPQWLQVTFSVALAASAVYHWLNGVRHSLWDKLIGLHLSSVYKSGYVVMIAFVGIMATLLFAWF